MQTMRLWWRHLSNRDLATCDRFATRHREAQPSGPWWFRNFRPVMEAQDDSPPAGITQPGVEELQRSCVHEDSLSEGAPAGKARRSSTHRASTTARRASGAALSIRDKSSMRRQQPCACWTNGCSQTGGNVRDRQGGGARFVPAG